MPSLSDSCVDPIPSHTLKIFAKWHDEALSGAKGVVEPVSETEADAYFRMRHRCFGIPWGRCHRSRRTEELPGAVSELTDPPMRRAAIVPSGAKLMGSRKS